MGKFKITVCCVLAAILVFAVSGCDSQRQNNQDTSQSVSETAALPSGESTSAGTSGTAADTTQSRNSRVLLSTENAEPKENTADYEGDPLITETTPAAAGGKTQNTTTNTGAAKKPTAGSNFNNNGNTGSGNSANNGDGSGTTATRPQISTTVPIPTTPAVTATDAPAIEGMSFEQQVVVLCNQEREKRGLFALKTGPANLQNAADLRAEEIKTSFSHTRPNGQSVFSILNEFGVSYSAAGENIAYGQRTAEQVVNSWMNSEGHKANILSSDFNTIAVGKNGTHWVQLFTRS